MDLLQICGLALTAAALSLLLRQLRGEYALMLGMAVTGLVLLALLPVLREIFSLLLRIASSSGTGETVAVLLKAIGLAFVAGLAADLCRDAGESAMAGRVETAGKVAILSLAMPMAIELMRLFERILG